VSKKPPRVVRGMDKNSDSSKFIEALRNKDLKWLKEELMLDEFTK